MMMLHCYDTTAFCHHHHLVLHISHWRTHSWQIHSQELLLMSSALSPLYVMFLLQDALHAASV